MVWSVQPRSQDLYPLALSKRFHPHYAGKFEDATVTGHCGFVFEKVCEVNVFQKLHFQNLFCPYEKAKSVFSNSSGLKGVLEQLRFRDGLVWTLGLTVEIKLRFQISPALCVDGSLE